MFRAKGARRAGDRPRKLRIAGQEHFAERRTEIAIKSLSCRLRPDAEKFRGSGAQ